MLEDYLDALDVRDLDPEVGVRLATRVVPAIVRRIDAAGCVVKVERGTDALEEFHARRDDGGLHVLLRRDRWALDRGKAITVALLRGGDIVGTIAASLMWVEGSLAAHLDAIPGHAATAVDAVERIASCHVVCAGGGYIERGSRGRDVYGDMFRLLLILALADWRWSWIFALFRETNDRANDRPWNPLRLAARTCMFEAIEPFVDVNGAPTYLGTMRRATSWTRVLT